MADHRPAGAEDLQFAYQLGENSFAGARAQGDEQLGLQAGLDANVPQFGAGFVPGGPLGGAVGDQSGDGEVSLSIGLTAAGAPQEQAPLPDFGVGVLETDPGKG
ncbi:hypothetical protein ACQPXS_37935 [Streptomyces sp. CA-142005]|uniref:hypothetical protein n=1 Tax=Streptomyces sp. CA-142005 TaxID=3240052 RepID=UPI003D8DDD23